MNENQLEKAKNDWGFSMDISLVNGKLYVANDGFITENPNDITAVKHSGYLNGLYYQYRRKGNVNELRNVIHSVSQVSGGIAV